METVIETAKGALITPLTNAPLLVAVGIGLLAFGWLLKLVPVFPNQWIPAAVILLGGAVGYFVVPMQGPADWAFAVSNPDAADIIRRVSVGLAVGVMVFLAHKYGVKRIERWAAARFGNGGDTAFIQKEETPKPEKNRWEGE